MGYDPLPNGHWAATKDVSASQARVDKVLYIKPDRMEAKMECLRVEEGEGYACHSFNSLPCPG